MESTIASGDALAPILYPSRVYDQNAEFVPLYYRVSEGDQFYTWWSPFLPLLSIPFYQLFGYLGLYVLPALCGALSAFFAGKTTHLLSRSNPAAWAVFAAVGIATPMAFYSQMFWEHTPSVLALLTALYAILKADQSGKARWAVLAGVCGSLSAAFRPESILILFGFGLVWLIKDWRKALWFGGAFVAACLPWMAFNLIQSGNALYPSMDQFAGRPSMDQISRGGVRQFITYVFFNAPVKYGAAISKPNLLIAGAGVLVSVVAPFIRRLRGLVVAGYLAVAWTALQLLVEPIGYRAIHGFILIAPLVLLGVWLFADFPRLRRSLFPWLVIGAILVMGAAYILKSWEAAGGLQWGPRYLLSFYPLLLIAGGVGLARAWPTFLPGLKYALVSSALILAVLGIAFEYRGINSVRETALYADSTATAVLEYSGKPMLLGCDADTLIPALYWQRPVYSILHSDLETWNDHLETIGVDSYYQIEFDLCFLNQLDEIAAYRQENPTGMIVQDCSVTQYQNQEENFCQTIAP